MRSHSSTTPPIGIARRPQQARSHETVEAYFSDLIGEVSGALINAADELAAEAWRRDHEPA
jgi:hypothetical protein